jgi:hypothetical protein
MIEQGDRVTISLGSPHHGHLLVAQAAVIRKDSAGDVTRRLAPDEKVVLALALVKFLADLFE